MFCKNCGKEIDNNAIYCPNCGAKNEYINSKSTNDSNQNSILGDLIAGAFGLTAIGIAIYFFNLAYDTLHTFNGISSSEAPGFNAQGFIFLLIGFVLIITAAVRIYNNSKKHK